MIKIQELCEISITVLQDYVKNQLSTIHLVDFKEFERELTEKLNRIHEDISSFVLEKMMDDKTFKSEITSYGSSLGLSNLERRKVWVQFRTGGKRMINSWYARVQKGVVRLEPHVGLSYLSFIKKASPLYVSTSSLFAVLCPSFDVAKQLMEELSITGKYNRIRDLSISLGQLSNNLGASFLVDSEEDMHNKRMVVMMDGGRGRTRVANGLYNEKGNAKFDAEWREVKVLVIQVIDEKGKVHRKEYLPLYDITIGGIEKAMSKLSELLVLINAKAAKGVQFIADGANCFWNRIKQIFEAAEVAKNKITYTLDYYHATEHLSELVQTICSNSTEQGKQYKILKTYLWNGQIDKLIERVRNICNQKNILIKDNIQTRMNYFLKHTERMQYMQFRQQKWLCGSGIVESAPDSYRDRRIVNLRFKAPSSFWKVEHLEPLCFLRAAFLSGRWHILMNNLK